ncbi:glycoside hydrolase family 47 protein [Stemphylium lycopersici]|nr:glycoside hydrolase family 47 protein [Stemphylium lycopersici]
MHTRKVSFGLVVRKRRQASIKATFEGYWRAYKQGVAEDGKMHTILTERSSALIDSLDTLWIMGLSAKFEKVVSIAVEMDLAPTDQLLSLSQTTRLLSVLLAVYDLTPCKDIRLLSKVMELGDMLYTFFDTPNRMPITSWNATKAANREEQAAAPHATPADLTSHSLVFTRLSQLTNDMRYYDAVTRITTALATQHHTTRIPGLWPTSINPQALDFAINNTFNLDTTSLPAYADPPLLLHLLAVSPATSPYTTLSTTAIDAIIRNLLFRPITPNNASILMASAAYTTPNGHVTRTHAISASSCALGSTLALSAALTRNGTHLVYARLVTEGCIWASLHSPFTSSTGTNIMPDSFAMLACSSADLKNGAEDCTFNSAVWPRQEHPGFEKVGDDARRAVVIRPEVMMSLFTLYRVTGEERWSEIAWEMWEGVEQTIREGLGQMQKGNVGDEEEFARVVQTLKYFYLLFSEPNVLSLDDWVIGSDGHALRAGSQ